MASLFEKIAAKQIPSTKVYEDDTVYAFRDISPTAPVHVLVIPKERGNLSSLSTAKESDTLLLGHLMWVAGQVGRQECPAGFRIVVNDGKEGCQSVDHLHLHVIGGKQLSWPPGTGAPEGSMTG